MGLLEDEYLRSQQLKATPRDQILGLLSDFIAKSYSPERTQQMQGVSKFMGAPAISETLDRLSYGQPLTTGAGGLGGTTRIRPEALETAMAVAPMVGPASRAAGAGAMAAGRAGERFAERAVPRVMERGGMGAEMLQGMSRNTVSPLDVYHGSPHKFDRFDASKIGTGEGAQAYGHGIYTAENPAVAKEYQVKLSSTGSAKNLASQFGDVDKGIAEAQRRIESYKQLIVNGGGGAMDRAKSMLKLSEKSLKDLLDMKAGIPANTGSLYKVDLPDKKIARMLDWDKPLSEQSEFVRNTLINDMGVDDNWATVAGDSSGSALYNSMVKEYGSPEAVSAALMNQGIPGIKYLDATSRGAGTGTRNFVTFPGEEQSMTILERNGQPMVARTQQQDATPDLLQYQQMLDEDERKKLGGLLFR
jgi:hypothetical protein